MNEKPEDINFIRWYKNKDFFFIEKMKPEYRKEYYCRSAWFARDEEVNTLTEEISRLKNIIEKMEKGLEIIKAMGGSSHSKIAEELLKENYDE